MKVGINAYLCSGRGSYRRTGVHRYIQELVSGLASMEHGPDLIAYVQESSTVPEWHGVTLREAPISVSRPPVRIAVECAGLPLLARRDKVDLFHGPVNTIPFGLGHPSVVTVHDLAFLLYPEQVTAKRFHYLKVMMGSSVKRARMVLTPSEATRIDIIERYALAPERVVVTPLGVDKRYQLAVDTKSTIPSTSGLPFILYVGTIEPRKNLARLIDASGRLQDRLPHDLVLAGPDGWLMDDVNQAIERFPVRERIRRLGFVDDVALANLYRDAAMVAIPSIYEGFGLPVLEAMSAGSPVLTSNVSSLPEVAGDAAEYVDPGSVESISAGIERLLTDSTRREELRVLGRSRAEGFTWKRTAELTMAAYREALL